MVCSDGMLAAHPKTSLPLNIIWLDGSVAHDTRLNDVHNTRLCFTGGFLRYLCILKTSTDDFRCLCVPWSTVFCNMIHFIFWALSLFLPLCILPLFTFSLDAVMFLFFLLWLWHLLDRIDALHGTQELIASVLILNRWFFNPDLREGVWRGRALWQEAFKPARSSGSCQIARNWKAWLTAQIFLSWGEHRNMQSYSPCHSYVKTEKELFSLFILQRKRCHFLAWEKTEEPSSSNTISTL